MKLFNRNKDDEYYIYTNFGWYGENLYWVDDFLNIPKHLNQQEADTIIQKIYNKIKNKEVDLFLDSKGRKRIIIWGSCQEAYMGKY